MRTPPYDRQMTNALMTGSVYPDGAKTATDGGNSVAPLLGYIETQRAMLNEVHYAISELEKRMHYLLEPESVAGCESEQKPSTYLPTQMGDLIQTTQDIRARIERFRARLLV